MPAARPASSIPRPLGVLICCFAFLAVLGGGSTCTWSSNHNDDDDLDDDDNNLSRPDDETTPGGGHGGLQPSSGAILKGLAELGAGTPLGGEAGELFPGLSLPELGGGELHLGDYAVDLDPRPGHHPVARVRDIAGLSVAREDRLGAMDARDFAAFSEAVLAANHELLGLPTAAGRLHPRSVHFLDQIVVVAHGQLRPGSPAVPPGATPPPGAEIPGSEMLFVFDLLGRLLQIENRTTLPPGVVVSLPEGLLPTR